jgi:hypothetical protein
MEFTSATDTTDTDDITGLSDDAGPGATTRDPLAEIKAARKKDHRHLSDSRLRRLEETGRRLSQEEVSGLVWNVCAAQHGVMKRQRAEASAVQVAESLPSLRAAAKGLRL